MSQITYSILSSLRSKRIKLTVGKNGEVTVTIPWRQRGNARVRDQIARFVDSKSAWIERRQRLMIERETAAEKIAYPPFEIAKAPALKKITERIKVYNQTYNFAFQTIRVKDLKSRWGSCSKRGNLNFNYRLGFLPEELIDYVVVHELCHLKELNHSPQFWELVEVAITNWRERRRGLRGILF